MLQEKVIAIYCLADDLLQEMNHSQHSNREFTDSQLITTALISALYFRGNQTMALAYMDSHVFTKVIKKSGFTKRLHRFKENLLFILLQIGRMLKYLHCQLSYIIDSFPVKACHNILTLPLKTGPVVKRDFFIPVACLPHFNRCLAS